ncbi:MAG: S1 RNA-binding domain-containing protein [Candidatus Anstonellales archaeon]
MDRDKYRVVKVTRIEEFGVYCDVLDQPGYQGFIPRGEVSSSWIRDISRDIRVNEIRVGKILSIDHNSKIIELSFRRVSEREKAEILQHYNNEQTAMNILRSSMNRARIKRSIESIAESIRSKYNSIYEFFRAASLDESVLETVDLPKTLKSYLKEEISKRFSHIIYRIRLDISAISYAEDGLDRIKQLFQNVTAKYIGGGKYIVNLEHKNPKELRKMGEQLGEELSRRAKELDIEFTYNLLEK